MSNATKAASASRRGHEAARKRQRRRRPLWIVAAGIAVLAVVAVVVAQEQQEDTPSNIQQTRPVTVTGGPLDQLPDRGVDPAAGKAAPALAGSTFDGTPISIAKDGRPKVLIFLAHWCSHCRNEVPIVQEWLDRVGHPNGLDLYSITTGTKSNLPNYPPSKWLEREKWSIKNLTDDDAGTAAAAFGLTGTPFYVAIDKDGDVVSRFSGEIGIDGLEQMIVAAKR